MDEKGKVQNIIKHMLYGYKVYDPLIKQEAPLTPSILLLILKKAKLLYKKFIMHLIIRVFFFAL